MSGTAVGWVFGTVIVFWIVVEFVTGFGAYLADKSPSERNDTGVLRRAAVAGTCLLLISAAIPLAIFVLRETWGGR